MPAPIAVVLAAGQGTRMRSQTPKVLHPICGVPMFLWPVHAALHAGAGQGLQHVVDHRTAGERVQRLRHAGAHAGPLAGSQDDGRGR